MTKVKVTSSDHIKAQQNVHLSGLKKVFVNASESETSLTQFAHGAMARLQESGAHAHKTMDEYFYFISGTGVYVIDDIKNDVYASIFVKIPAGIIHNLINVGDRQLEFVYFGIATE